MESFQATELLEEGGIRYCNGCQDGRPVNMILSFADKNSKARKMATRENEQKLSVCVFLTVNEIKKQDNSITIKRRTVLFMIVIRGKFNKSIS